MDFACTLYHGTSFASRGWDPSYRRGAADSETTEDDGGVLVVPSGTTSLSHTVSVLSLSHHQ